MATEQEEAGVAAVGGVGDPQTEPPPVPASATATGSTRARGVGVRAASQAAPVPSLPPSDSPFQPPPVPAAAAAAAAAVTSAAALGSQLLPPRQPWTVSFQNKTGGAMSATVNRATVCGPTRRVGIEYSVDLSPGTMMDISVDDRSNGGDAARSRRVTVRLRLVASGGFRAHCAQNLYVFCHGFSIAVIVFPFSPAGEGQAAAHMRATAAAVQIGPNTAHSSAPQRLAPQLRRITPPPPSNDGDGESSCEERESTAQERQHLHHRATAPRVPGSPDSVRGDTDELTADAHSDAGDGGAESKWGTVQERAVQAKRVYHFVVSLMVMAGLALLGITVVYIVFVGDLQVSLAGSLSLRRME